MKKSFPSRSLTSTSKTSQYQNQRNQQRVAAPVFQAKTLDIIISGEGSLSPEEYEKWRAFFNTLIENAQWRALTVYNCRYNRPDHAYNEELALRMTRRTRFRSTRTFSTQEEVDKKAEIAKSILVKLGFYEQWSTKFNLAMKWRFPEYFPKLERLNDAELWRTCKEWSREWGTKATVESVDGVDHQVEIQDDTCVALVGSLGAVTLSP